ncbi:16S rRNA pseudouridine(516) synthase, partial [Listeria monocytogenes]|nr:16S rRNA pseudouridine(516) synthase [Listeria monocytogenes]
MRLDKVIEQQLNTSRKEMKRLFQQGKVLVDQRIEGRPERNVDSAIHQIIVAGRQLETQERYYIVNKPNGVVTA